MANSSSGRLGQKYGKTKFDKSQQQPRGSYPLASSGKSSMGGTHSKSSGIAKTTMHGSKVR